MIARYASSLFHTSSSLREEATKTLLATLRKKTGYTFSNCKKALELNENDIIKAEMWLNKQAKDMGWEQLKKVKGRTTSQGLIGVMVQNNKGVLVEVNCETDFVARNEKFHNLVKAVTSAIFEHVPPINSARTIDKSNLSAEKLLSIPAADGVTLADHTAMAIGSIRENIILKRAFCMTAAPELKIFGDVHPACEEEGNILYGKYGALIATKTEGGLLCPGQELCKQIIGMRPAKIGDPIVDIPKNNKDDEMCLIYQEFIMEQNMTVQEILEQTKTKVLDYARFEVGEEYEENPQTMETVEVCG